MERTKKATGSGGMKRLGQSAFFAAHFSVNPWKWRKNYDKI